jgi:hypothetical protein
MNPEIGSTDRLARARRYSITFARETPVQALVAKAPFPLSLAQIGSGESCLRAADSLLRTEFM